MVTPQKMAEAIQTWTDAELAAEPQTTFMSWADAVLVVGAAVQADIDQAESQGDTLKARALRDAWSIILTGAAR